MGCSKWYVFFWGGGGGGEGTVSVDWWLTQLLYAV